MNNPDTSTSTRDALIERLLAHLDRAGGRRFPDHPKPSRAWWQTAFHLANAIRAADLAANPPKGSTCNPTPSTPQPSRLAKLLQRLKASSR